MKEPSTLNLFPKTQVKPFDGMSITAEVWDQAHEEHRQALHAHSLHSHGSGIITGLEVVANDPPDQYVFISAGVAVDPAGNVIVVPEPVAYDFGETAVGPLFLLLGQGESEIGGVGNEVRFTQYEFVIAARPTLPKRPSVELARITLTEERKAIRNAVDEQYPASNILDLRYRSQVGAVLLQQVKVLVAALGSEEPDVVNGWNHLGCFCRQAAHYQLIVDGGTQLPQDASAYDLVYLACKGSFTLNAAQTKTLTNYLEQGKTLLVEAFGEAGQSSSKKMFTKLKLNPEKPAANSPLFSAPFLFAEAPAGISGNQVQVGEHLLYSTAGYALSWTGKAASGVASRADIRSAHEWGVNLLHKCLTQAGKQV